MYSRFRLGAASCLCCRIKLSMAEPLGLEWADQKSLLLSMMPAEPAGVGKALISPCFTALPFGVLYKSLWGRCSPYFPALSNTPSPGDWAQQGRTIGTGEEKFTQSPIWGGTGWACSLRIRLSTVSMPHSSITVSVSTHLQMERTIKVPAGPIQQIFLQDLGLQVVFPVFEVPD